MFVCVCVCVCEKTCTRKCVNTQSRVCMMHDAHVKGRGRMTLSKLCGRNNEHSAMGQGQEGDTFNGQR